MDYRPQAPGVSATRALILRHMAAVAVVVLLACGALAVFQRELDLDSRDREEFRVMNRLATLSRRIRATGEKLLLESDPALIPQYRDDLGRSLEALRADHEAASPAWPHRDALEARQMSESWSTLTATAETLLSPEANPAERQDLDLRLQHSGEEYEACLARTAEEIRAEAEQRTLRYHLGALALLGGILLALVLDSLLVFRPAVDRIRRTIADLESTRRRLGENLQALRSSHRIIKADLKAAARIQRSLLPNEPPEIPGVEVSWIFDSCDEVAGDMFNIFRLDEHRVGLYILDVCGHGVQAAMLSVSVTRALTPLPMADGLIKRRVPTAPSYEIVPPSEVARELNRRFPVMAQSDQFFTFLYGILDLRTGQFTYVQAGHPAPIHLRGRRARVREGPVALPIGIEEDVEYREETMDLKPGDAVVFFTDGVPELLDAEGRAFGRERMLSALAEEASLGISASLHTLRQRMAAFAERGSRRDDISVLGLGLLDGASLPPLEGVPAAASTMAESPS